MSSLSSVELELSGTKDLALVGNDDSVWLVVPIRWWDLATLLFWLFIPSDRKSNVTLTLRGENGGTKKVKLKAVRVATRHIRVRGI